MPHFRRDDAVMHASEATTEALRQTTQLMQQELERSILSTQMLGIVLPIVVSRCLHSFTIQRSRQEGWPRRRIFTLRLAAF